MLFCVKTPINKLYVFGMALLLAATLAGCGGGGGGGSAQMPEPTPMPTPTPQEQCEDAGGRWNANMTCTSAEDIEAERMAMVTAATKAAKTKDMAIMAELAQNTDATTPINAGLGGDAGLGADGAPGGGDDTYSLSISRDRTGTKVTIADSALAGDDDPKFMQAMDLGGGRTMHTRAMAADDDGNVVEEVVIVGTDIEVPTATAFAMVEGQALNARDLDATEDADGDGTPDNDFTALTIAAGADDVNLPKIMSPAFAAATGDTVTHTFDFDDAATTDEDEADEVAGTYNGAMGTYRCDGDVDCTVTLDGDGEVTAIGAGWVFTPDEGATSDVPDADHLHYGFWLKKTTDADGAVTYNEVETFASSSVAASGATSTVQGKATYAGGAVGVYVHKTFKTDGTYDASSGHFTADVSLMATFGQVPVSDTDNTGTIAPNLLNTVSGTIGNFMLSGDEEQMWSVDVQGAITESDGTASGTAKGGVGDGSFSATFHGDVTAAADGTVPQPGSVVGEFNAGFTNGSVAGGFGARKQ